jgi:hypothetical protein
MASKSKIIAELFEADGDIIASALDNVVVTPTAVSDQPNTSTGGLTLPSGTTAQRPSSPDAGESRYNSTIGSLEFYDGSNWIATNLIPTISSVTGTIFNTLASDLTLAVVNNTDTISVIFKEGSTTIATVADVSVSSGSATVTVPSAVYGQSIGDTIVISVQNIDGTPSSNSQSKTVVGLPTGGTITTYGNYRVHSFTSSGTFTVPSGVSASTNYLIVAGGGGAGTRHSGGGGAGGLRTGTQSISAQTYTVQVGGGGAGGASGTSNDGVNGTNSYISPDFGSAAVGGGNGSGVSNVPAGNGGSGGGGRGSGAQAGGSGTSGQGNSGGAGHSGNGGGGGGGAGAAGAAGQTGAGGAGGVGSQNNYRTGSNVYYAGGGGGAGDHTASGGAGGNGGGGAGKTTTSDNSVAGTANSGGGGGSGGHNDPSSVEGYAGKSGGSGIVVIRYDTTTL